MNMNSRVARLDEEFKVVSVGFPSAKGEISYRSPGSPLPNDDECEFGGLSGPGSFFGHDLTNLVDRIWQRYFILHALDGMRLLTMNCSNLNILDSRKFPFRNPVSEKDNTLRQQATVCILEPLERLLKAE